MRNTVFRSGLHPRLLAALGYAALVFGSVALLTRSEPSPPRATSPDSSAAETGARAHSVRLELQSVREIGTWQVECRGRPIEATFATTRLWEAVIHLDPQAEPAPISILALAGEKAIEANALRLRLYRDESIHPVVDRTTWCAGPDCVIEIDPREGAR